MEQGIHYDGMPLKNPYRVLGISHKATDAVVKRAYRRLVVQCHPDKHSGTLTASQRADLDRRWHEIKDAHAFLSDADRAREKSKFDAHLASVEASERVCQRASERVRQEEEARFRNQDCRSDNNVRREEEERCKTERHSSSYSTCERGLRCPGCDAPLFALEAGTAVRRRCRCSVFIRDARERKTFSANRVRPSTTSSSAM